MYGLLCYNYRAIATAHYLHIGISDVIIAGLSFTVIKKVAEAKTKTAWVGYTLGGLVGSLVSTWVSKNILGV
jgi:hypothetical protein